MIELLDHDDVLRFSHRQLLNYTGYGNRIAAAITYRMFKTVLTCLCPKHPVDRRSFLIRSAFKGSGIIDGIEFITRAESESRLEFINNSIPPEAPGSPLGSFYFEFYLRNRGCSLILNPVYFPKSFAEEVGRALDGVQTRDEQTHYDQTREEMAQRILTAPEEILFACQAIEGLHYAPRLEQNLDPDDNTTIQVVEGEDRLTFTFADMIAFHGRENIGGSGLGFKALQYALPRLSPHEPPQRRNIHIFSAFAGSGVLDVFELVLRVISDERLEVDIDAKIDGAEPAPTGSFYFQFSSDQHSLNFTLKPGLVPENFLNYARKNKTGVLSKMEKSLFQTVKEELAMTLLKSRAEDLFEEID